jgi:hypothetical protein
MDALAYDDIFPEIPAKGETFLRSYASLEGLGAAALAVEKGAQAPWQRRQAGRVVFWEN